MLDNFNEDPMSRVAMVQTAENVARELKISTEEQNEVVVQRYNQYLQASENDRAFLRRYMTLPFPIPDQRLSKTIATLDGDEGIYKSTAEGLARLKPQVPGGTVTFGGQTHPADGNAGIIVTTDARARELRAILPLPCTSFPSVEPGNARPICRWLRSKPPATRWRLPT